MGLTKEQKAMQERKVAFTSALKDVENLNPVQVAQLYEKYQDNPTELDRIKAELLAAPAESVEQIVESNLPQKSESVNTNDNPSDEYGASVHAKPVQYNVEGIVLGVRFIQANKEGSRARTVNGIYTPADVDFERSRYNITFKTTGGEVMDIISTHVQLCRFAPRPYPKTIESVKDFAKDLSDKGLIVKCQKLEQFSTDDKGNLRKNLYFLPDKDMHFDWREVSASGDYLVSFTIDESGQILKEFEQFSSSKLQNANYEKRLDIETNAKIKMYRALGQSPKVDIERELSVGVN